MKLDGKRLRLYAVTDQAWASGPDALLAQVADAIDGGAGIVQLREKHLDHDAFLEEAKRFVALCREKGAISIINDDVEVALAVGADGVHVGQEDLAAGRAREVLGPDKIVGVSAHSVAEAQAAQAAGADYQAHYPGHDPGHHGGGGHSGGGHRWHHPGEPAPAFRLRSPGGGGGLRPVCSK